MSIGIVKKLLKTTGNKKKKTVMLARSKLNSIESKISETLINKGISHEDFTTIVNKKKSIRMSTQRSDTEKTHLIEEEKRKDIDEIIR